VLLDEEGKRIDLIDRLRKVAGAEEESFVIEARMGAQKKLPVRVVAVRLPESVANERRRKARADRDKRISHDKAYYELLGWTLLVTNLPEEAVNDLDLTKLYALRWRIENIFKAWKSGLKPGHLSAHKSNKWHIHCLLLGQMLALSRLSRIGVFTIGGDSERQVSHGTTNHSEISLFKAMDVLLLCDPAMNQTMLHREVIEQIRYHGRYEKRKREPLPVSLAKLA
jgi:IS4 transposase